MRTREETIEAVIQKAFSQAGKSVESDSYGIITGLVRLCVGAGLDAGLELAAEVAEATTVPEVYDWPYEATQRFNDGVRRAALVIRALKEK